MQRISITNPQNIIDGTAKKYYFKLRNTGGPKGDKGDKGDTGATGPQGPQGNAATVSVGSTTTLPVGYDATVTNAGSIYNAVLDFGIPQGPQGPQGAKGDKGDTGAKGDTGPRGPQGERGTNATVYIGTTTTLNPGTQATVYNSGTDSNAVLNFGIPKGEKGDTGATGATGATGPAGQDGQNFTPTIVAELPATGDESKLYLTPKAHTTSTATGNPIEATITAQAGQLESFQLDGDTFQQTYTGKNLFAPPVGDSASGVIFTLNADGTYDISGTATARAQIVLFLDTPWLENGEIYTIKANQPLGDVMARVEAYSNTSYLRTNYVLDSTSQQQTGAWNGENATKCCFVLRVESGKTVNISGLGIQLEKGSTATSFEKFVGGQPSPSPDYPQPIQTVTGEQTVTIASLNLFDGIFELGNISTTTGTDINADTMIRSKNYAVIDGGENYTISVVGGGNVALRFYQSNGTFIGTGTTGQSPNTFTAPANAGRVRFIITSNTNLSTKAQCEKGSSATDWTPYYEPVIYPLDLGTIELCKLGTYQDYIYKDGESWKVHKATDKYIFDGSETPTVNTSSTNTTRCLMNNLLPSDSPAKPEDSGYVASNYFIYGVVWSSDEQGIYANNRAVVFRGNKTTIGTTLAEVQTWLTANKPSLYYALNTPTDTVITDTTLIAQLEAIRTASLENGTNTITNTAAGSNLAGDMEIGYYGYNPTNRYDKFIWLDINDNYEQIGE